MEFKEIAKGIWESDRQAYTAAMLTSDGKPVGIKEARYRIEEGTKKDAKIYRVYEAHLGGYRFVKSHKTIDAAIKSVH